VECFKEAKEEMKKKAKKVLILLLLEMGTASTFLSCSTIKSALAIRSSSDKLQPIHNPFDLYSWNQMKQENIILRTKKGERSVEIELPGSTADMTDFVVPLAPSFREKNTSSRYEEGTLDEKYNDKPPGITDREITRKFASLSTPEDGKRREVETELGVIPADPEDLESNKSYLAAIDRIKQLYKKSRYEAALLEMDDMLRLYPMDAKVYQMRGTLLDRIGKPDLAIRSWNQALKFDPSNASLKRFVERKQQKRSFTTP
jgi:tetratricopeptide (TPR) repeat protein